MPLLLGAAIWGLAEATVFFLVPDILLSYIALKHGVKKACIAAFYAVLGAVIGGMLMYCWGMRAESPALAFLQQIPAIGADMFETVRNQLQTYGVWGVFLGTANGIPYKIYPVLAPAQDISFLMFAIASVPARLYRFLITALLAAGTGRLMRSCSDRLRWGMFAAFWFVGYAMYFYHFMT